jgi:hypothetical protein
LKRVAEQLGFVGSVEYRHVWSSSGGAQYGRGQKEHDDLLIVYAEAFAKDADPEEFSLTAILAHECGHQLLARHPRIASRVAGRISDASEEILASLLGAMICPDPTDHNNLIAKAASVLVQYGDSTDAAFEKLQNLQDLFGKLL